MAYKQLKDKTGADFEPMTPSKVGFPKWGLPHAIRKNWDTLYTATESGWIAIMAGDDNTSSDRPVLYLNGDVWSIIENGGTSSYIAIRLFVPVKKGQTYKMGGGVEFKTLYFIPEVST